MTWYSNYSRSDGMVRERQLLSVCEEDNEELKKEGEEKCPKEEVLQKNTSHMVSQKVLSFCLSVLSVCQSVCLSVRPTNHGAVSPQIAILKSLFINGNHVMCYYPLHDFQQVILFLLTSISMQL